MAYTIIQPPFTLRFHEMAISELKGYFSWFMEVLPGRVAELQAEVRNSPSHATWCADNSIPSLDPLGEWFATQVETRKKTQEELMKDESRLVTPIDIPTWQLTNKTFSVAMDVGMYFSQVILKNLEGTRWELLLAKFGKRKHADYGQPVIMGFGRVSLNPVRVVRTLAYGIASGKDGKQLRGLFDTWASMRRDD